MSCPICSRPVRHREGIPDCCLSCGWGVRSHVAAVLDQAERIGAEEDAPEGARYILLSDTLACELAKMLRGDG